MHVLCKARKIFFSHDPEYFDCSNLNFLWDKICLNGLCTLLMNTYLHVYEPYFSRTMYIFSNTVTSYSQLHYLAIYFLEKAKVVHGDLIISIKTWQLEEVIFSSQSSYIPVRSCNNSSCLAFICNYKELTSVMMKENNCTGFPKTYLYK